VASRPGKGSVFTFTLRVSFHWGVEGSLEVGTFRRVRVAG
jgi:hypothetical protein